MTDHLDHVLLTRFNLPSGGAESYVRAKEDWLVKRVALFERYCLPSVLDQQQQDFCWIIYLDPESPLWLKAKMAKLRAEGACHDIYRTEVPKSVLLGDIRTALGDSGNRLITTNLDNDDALAVDFTARVRRASTTHPQRTAVFLSKGLIRKGNGLYLRQDPHNAFCSVSEPWDPQPVTCWSAWHIHLAETMPTRMIGGDPGWLQVVHGDNVSNRVRGRRVSPEAYRQLVPGALDDLNVPTRQELACETLVSQPKRWVMDMIRGAGKAVIRRFFGTEGIAVVRDRLNSGKRQAQNEKMPG